MADTLVRYIIDQLLLSKDSTPAVFTKLCFLQPQRVKKIMDMLIQRLAQRFLNNVEFEENEQNSVISAVASLLRNVTADDQNCRNQLISWCTVSAGAGLGDAIGIRRAVLSALSQERDSMVTVFEKSLSQFGDQLYIKHTPILQQEGEPGESPHTSVANSFSPCPSVASQRRLRFQAVSYQINNANPIRYIPGRHIESNRIHSSSCPVLGHGGRRIPFSSA